MSIGILLVHLSPNDLALETHDFVDRLNGQTDAHFAARHGWIVAFGDIKRLLRSDTLAGWAGRRAVKRFPIWSLDNGPLLRQLNRYIKSQVRRQQKSRPNLWRRYGYKRRPYCGLVSPRLSDRESFAAVTNRVVALLQSIAENPADITVSGWYRRQYISRMPGLGLNDYTELVSFSFDGVNRIRQYAPYPARSVSVPSADIPSPVPVETQRTLEYIGRLYKYGCHHPDIDAAPLFGAPQASEPVLCLWPPRAVRRASLERTRSDYNDRWQSFQTYGRMGLSKDIRLRGSLNIPRETIELRNNMIANLEHDFDRRDEARVA